MDISKLCYELYKVDWKHSHMITAEREMDSIKNYFEGLVDDENEYNAAQRNLLFDDETLSVSYQLHNETIFSRVCDTLPVFIIIASCAFIIVFIVSVAIYFKKKKSLN